MVPVVVPMIIPARTGATKAYDNMSPFGSEAVTRSVNVMAKVASVVGIDVKTGG